MLMSNWEWIEGGAPGEYPLLQEAFAHGENSLVQFKNPKNWHTNYTR